ncbi:hypothetical protein IJ182_01955, partial [bacterium]|nr:hypothetical protein [bacterium]
KVYDEISKNYEYTNQQNEELKNSLGLDKDINTLISENAELINAQTDEKISKVYDEISKNYEYTNQQHKNALDYVNSGKIEIDKTINDKIDFLLNQTNGRISEVYDEISKNYDYTNEKNTELEAKFENNITEIKKNFNENIEAKVSDTNSKITNILDEIIKNKTENEKHLTKLNNEIASQNKEVENIKSDIILKNNEIKEDLKNQSEKLYNDINSDIEKILNEISQNKSDTNEKVNNIENEIKENSEFVNNQISEIKNVIQEESKLSKEQIKQTQETINQTKEALINQNKEKQNLLNSKIDDLRTFTNKHLEEQNNSLIQLITDKNNDTQKQLENKTEEIFAEIEKDLKYTESLVEVSEEKQKFALSDAVENVKSIINTTKSETENLLNNKINDIYSYTDTKFQQSEILTDEKINNANNLIRKEHESKLNNLYTFANEETAKLYIEVKNTANNLENTFNDKIYDIYKNNEAVNYELQALRTNINEKPDHDSLKKLKQDIKENINKNDSEHLRYIEGLKSNFEDKINQQRIKYENKLMSMEERIKQLNSTIEYMQKNPIEKLFNKIKNKPEKRK